MNDLLDDNTLYALLDEVKAEMPMVSRLGELKALVNKVAAWERARCAGIVERQAAVTVDDKATEALHLAVEAIKDRNNRPLTSDGYRKESGRGLS